MRGQFYCQRFFELPVTPYLTNVLTSADYGKMSIGVFCTPFLNVLFTYGMETAYFPFSSKEESKNSIYNTTATSIIISTFYLVLLLLFSQTTGGICRHWQLPG